MEKVIVSQGRFSLHANVAGVDLDAVVQSYEEGVAALEKLAPIARDAMLQEHCMVKGDQRGFWLTVAWMDWETKQVMQEEDHHRDKTS